MISATGAYAPLSLPIVVSRSFVHAVRPHGEPVVRIRDYRVHLKPMTDARGDGDADTVDGGELEQEECKAIALVSVV